VGGERNIRVDPRVIAATNRDLKAAVAGGTFRENLYFRLGAFVIEVPPLRDRREEIPALTHQFLRTAARKMKKDVCGLQRKAMTVLMNHRWPGNVRELETPSRGPSSSRTGRRSRCVSFRRSCGRIPRIRCPRIASTSTSTSVA
jgi:transcriptional regulator with GAF, ATPase, and Fis domain